MGDNMNKKEYFDGITAHHAERQEQILKEGVLCDGDCGRSYLQRDLEKTAYHDRLCGQCMFDFVRDQEDFIELNKGDQDVIR
jgi:hypothetical protein